MNFEAACSARLVSRKADHFDSLTESAMTQSFAAAIRETLEYLEKAIARIEKGEAAEAEAHNIRAYLINTLDLTERDPGIEAAADDLYAMTAAFVPFDGAEVEHGPERGDRGALRQAFLQLMQKLAGARPSAKARATGLR